MHIFGQEFIFTLLELHLVEAGLLVQASEAGESLEVIVKDTRSI